MPRFQTQPLLDELTAAAEAHVPNVEALQALPDDVLQWKPSPDRWSVAECIEHLNIANRHYVPEIARRIAAAPAAEVDSYKTAFVGNYFATAMHPDRISKRVKTPKMFNPASSTVDAEAAFETHLDHSRQIVDLLAQARQHDLGRIRITSALGNILRFRLGDALRLVVYHNQRHLLQARNVLAEREKVAA